MLQKTRNQEFESFSKINYNEQKQFLNLKLEFKDQQNLDEQVNTVGKQSKLDQLQIWLQSVDLNTKCICLRSFSECIKNLTQLKYLLFLIDGNNLTQIQCFSNLLESLTYLKQLSNLNILIQWNLIDPAELSVFGHHISEMKNIKFLSLSNTSDQNLQDNVLTILNNSLQQVTQLISFNIDLQSEKQIIFLNLIDYIPLCIDKFYIGDKQIIFRRNKETKKTSKLECSIQQKFDEDQREWLQQGLSQLRNLKSLVINLNQSKKCSYIVENPLEYNQNNQFLNHIPLKKLKIKCRYKLQKKCMLNWFSQLDSRGKLSQLNFQFERQCSVRFVVELSTYIQKFNNLHKLVISIKLSEGRQQDDFNQNIDFGKTIEYLDTNLSPLLLFKYIENNQRLKAITFSDVLSHKDEIEKTCQCISSIKSLDLLNLNINYKRWKYNFLNFNFDQFQKIKDLNIQINIYNINYLYEFLKQMKKVTFCDLKHSYSLTISFGYDNNYTCQYGILQSKQKEAEQRISLSLKTRKVQNGENELILRIKENRFIQLHNSEQLATSISSLININRLSITIFEINDKIESQIAAMSMIEHLKQMNQLAQLDIFIYRNNLQQEGVMKISNLLQTFNNIRHCSLRIGYDNSIQAKGACELGRAIAQCKSLKSLILQFGTKNQINNYGVIGLFEGIQQLSLLEKLQFIVYQNNELNKNAYEIIFKGCTNLSKLYDFSLLLDKIQNSFTVEETKLFAFLQQIKYLRMELDVIQSKQMPSTRIKAMKQLKRLVMFKQYSYQDVK